MLQGYRACISQKISCDPVEKSSDADNEEGLSFQKLRKKHQTIDAFLWLNFKEGARSQFRLDCGPEAGSIVCGIGEMGNGILLLRDLRIQVLTY